MSYIDEFKGVIFGYAHDVQKYLSGDRSDYIYCAQTSPESGTFDKNYSNRTKLCYALVYDVCKVPNKKEFVRELFLEELKDRETNSFQGIGYNLEILSSLLLEFGDPDDKVLFDRAKNANFDCACGYEPRIFKEKPLDEYSICDCINLLSELGETELMFKLTDEFKSGELDIEDLEELRSIAKWCTDRSCDKEFALSRLYEKLQAVPELFKKIDAVVLTEEHIDILLKKGEVENALAVFNEQRALFSRFKRNCYEVGAKLIAAGAVSPESIWTDILPYIKEDLKTNMVAPINKDSILAAARIAGDGATEKKLVKYFKRRGR